MPHFVTKQYRAEIAHRIPGYPGDCQYIHGHSYLFEITITIPELDNLGMVYDFKYLKAGADHVISPWDHSLLLWEKDLLVEGFRNEIGAGIRLIVLPFIPTAENMAKYIAQEMNLWLPDEIEVEQVRVWETSTSYADWIKSC